MAGAVVGDEPRRVRVHRQDAAVEQDGVAVLADRLLPELGAGLRVEGDQAPGDVALGRVRLDVGVDAAVPDADGTRGLRAGARAPADLAGGGVERGHREAGARAVHGAAPRHAAGLAVVEGDALLGGEQARPPCLPAGGQGHRGGGRGRGRCARVRGAVRHPVQGREAERGDGECGGDGDDQPPGPAGALAVAREGLRCGAAGAWGSREVRHGGGLGPGSGPGLVLGQGQQQAVQFGELGTGRRVLVQTVLGDAPQRLGHPVQPGLFVHDLIARQVRTGAVEGAVAGGRVDEERAEREDVGGGGDVPGCGELLGRHEGRGADQPARHGEGLVVGGAGDAEVDDAGTVLGEQHVAGLQVPVHDARLVDVPQRLDKTEREGAQGPAVQRAVLLDGFGQGAAGHVERGHPGEFGVRVGVDDGGGEGSAHPAGGGDLLPEAGAELLVQRVLRVHDLDGDLPARGRAPEVHDAHPAAAEPVDQRVTTDRLRVPGAKRHVAGHLS